MHSLHILAALLLPILAAGKGCTGSRGFANGECVALFSNGDCNDAGKVTQYKPTCEGNCYQYSSFNSVRVGGDGTYGTDCVIYSDNNCKNKISDTGNQIRDKCASVPGGNSMKCYYRC